MTSQINGKLWHDLNGNGFQDSFEPGIAGGTVYLDDNHNGEFDIGERSTLTDEDGNYTFSDLEAGTYIVAQTLAPGWQQMFPNPSQPGERLFATPADGSDEIVELNAVTGTEINRFTVPTWISGGPDGLAFNGSSLFLTNGSNDLWEIDPNTGDLIDTDSLSIGDNFDGLATIGDKVYLLDHIANDIIEFDPVSDTVTNVLDIDWVNPGVELVAGLSGDSASNQLWATDGHDQVFQIDPETGQVVQSFFANTGNANAGVAVIGGEIYLGSLDHPQEINVVDQNGLLQRTIDIVGKSIVKYRQTKFHCRNSLRFYFERLILLG